MQSIDLISRVAMISVEQGWVSGWMKLEHGLRGVFEIQKLERDLF
jgi:hypothetical protein